jgi:hypothetical protein
MMTKRWLRLKSCGKKPSSRYVPFPQPQPQPLGQGSIVPTPVQANLTLVGLSMISFHFDHRTVDRPTFLKTVFMAYTCSFGIAFLMKEGNIMEEVTSLIN